VRLSCAKLTSMHAVLLQVRRKRRTLCFAAPDGVHSTVSTSVHCARQESAAPGQPSSEQSNHADERDRVVLRRLSDPVSTATHTVPIPAPGRKPARVEAARSVVFEHVRCSVQALWMPAMYAADLHLELLHPAMW